ncbi:hypothetical protein [Nannocystis sp.]|uniref:hypothetical protein n=1 Tax=Nannocystis sp. TaxID=1962667 RepID=UPI00344B0C0D|nr:hypothetical protein [Nannocystis sp.]
MTTRSPTALARVAELPTLPADDFTRELWHRVTAGAQLITYYARPGDEANELVLTAALLGPDGLQLLRGAAHLRPPAVRHHPQPARLPRVRARDPRAARHRLQAPPLAQAGPLRGQEPRAHERLRVFSTSRARRSTRSTSARSTPA